MSAVPAPQTHNRFLDTSRTQVRASAFPTPLSSHDLECAQLLAANARQQLLEAFRLVGDDYLLKVKCETAGDCCRDFMRSIGYRIEGKKQ